MFKLYIHDIVKKFSCIVRIMHATNWSEISQRNVTTSIMLIYQYAQYVPSIQLVYTYTVWVHSNIS